MKHMSWDVYGTMQDYIRERKPRVRMALLYHYRRFIAWGYLCVDRSPEAAAWVIDEYRGCGLTYEVVTKLILRHKKHLNPKYKIRVYHKAIGKAVRKAGYKPTR
jgi:hypothetical protein